MRTSPGGVLSLISLGSIDQASRLRQLSEPALVCILTVVILNLIPGVSRQVSNFILVMMRMLVTTGCIAYVTKLRGHAPGTPFPFQAPLESLGGDSAWPKDLRTAFELLELDPEVVVYACCPTCWTVYPPNDDGTYKAFCSTKKTRTSPMFCNTRLTLPRNKGEKPKPIKPFPFQPPLPWVQRLLSRPGIIEKMEAITARTGLLSRVRDIFQAQLVTDFTDSDGKPFFAQVPGQLRLGFSLNIDWFNPFGRRTSGKHGSVGGIYMVCMNLPINLRYRLENVYLVGIIPGPTEPDVDQINHILAPLVDGLIKLWQPGFIFNSGVGFLTYLVRCAIVILVCDLPAMRKVAGFIGHSAHTFMCSFCLLSKKDINNLDASTFPRRSPQDHRDAAARARDGDTSVITTHGIRWSEMLRLPYWDPIKSCVVDSMHNIFLGIVKQHCRYIWGMDAATSDYKDTKSHDTATQKTFIALMEDLMDQLANGGKFVASRFNSIRRGYIEAFCDLNHVPLPDDDGTSTKKTILESLAAWVSVICFCLSFH